MAIAVMKKLCIIGHATLRSSLIEALQRQGIAQIAEVPAQDAASLALQTQAIALEEAQGTLNRLQEALHWLERWSPQEKRGMLAGFLPPDKLDVSPSQWQQWTSSPAMLEQIYAKAQALNAQFDELRSEEKRLEALRQTLLPWARLQIPVEQLHSSPRVRCQFAQLPLDQLDALEQAAGRSLAWFERLYAHVQESKCYGCFLTPADQEEEFLKLASSHGLERLPDLSALLPAGMKGAPEELLKELAGRLAQCEKKRLQLDAQALELLRHQDQLKALYDHWNNALHRLQAMQKAAGSRSAFALYVWVRKQDLAQLHQALAPLSEGLFIEECAVAPDESPPVALVNRRLSKPAELVVRLFGLPVPQGIDPTPTVMPFFALFFGLALTDAGYGLSLVVIFSLLKRAIKSPGFKQFANLLIVSGFTAIVAGALTGGWFGPELVQIIPPLKALYLFDVNGSSGLVAFLGVAMILGFIQVILGHLISLGHKLRMGEAADAIWGEGTWIFLLLCLGVYAGIGLPGMLNMPGLPASWEPLASKSALFAFLAVLFMTRAGLEGGRPLSAQLPWGALTVVVFLLIGVEGIAPLVPLALAAGALAWAGWTAPKDTVGGKVVYVLGRLGLGLFKLYGVTGFMGDVLSYSRLMALGIATGLIAMSINTFAVVMSQLLPEAFGLPPAVGIAMAVLILLVGQPVSLVINSLSAFVHSARLHYVEYFTKFYQSGGEPFQPFKRESAFFNLEHVHTLENFGPVVADANLNKP